MMQNAYENGVHEH